MKNIVQRTFASVGAAICMGGAAVFWRWGSFCPVPALLLVRLFALGLAGPDAVFLASKEFFSRWRGLTWAICGAILSLTLLTVWFTAPWVLLATLVFGGAATGGGCLILVLLRLALSRAVASVSQEHSSSFPPVRNALESGRFYLPVTRQWWEPSNVVFRVVSGQSLL